jgi:hypothetical protein
MEKKSLLQNLEKKMEEKFDEGVARGMDLGREEGYTLAKQGFDRIISAVKARDTPRVSTDNASTQTDLPATTTMSKSISTQTNPAASATTPQAWNFINNGVSACLARTAAVSVQTETVISHPPSTPISTYTEHTQSLAE